MVPCLPSHFSKYGGELSEIYAKQNLKNALCWPNNFTAMLGGKFSSEFFGYIHIRTRKCQSNCVNET
jgi:hypothetical protein